MKKNVYRIISIVLFPFYAGAYLLSHALRMKGREDMPTFTEWFEMETE